MPPIFRSWTGSLRQVLGGAPLKVLLACDLLAIALHVLRSLEINVGLSLSFLSSDLFALDLERSFAELYQVLKLASVAVILYAI